MMHLSDDDLRQWRDEPRESERERILAHLRDCASCSTRYATMFRTRPPDTTVVLASEAMKTRGYHAYSPRPVNKWTVFAFRPVAALASIGLIVVVLWTMRDRSTEPLYRGGTKGVELLAPSDGATVSNQVTFEWKADKSGGCRLRVFDPSSPDAPVIDRRTESGAQVSAAERERLVAGITYRWFVECSSAEGERVVSPSRRFDIR